jgi:hypothetical protein
MPAGVWEVVRVKLMGLGGFVVGVRIRGERRAAQRGKEQVWEGHDITEALTYETI